MQRQRLNRWRTPQPSRIRAQLPCAVSALAVVLLGGVSDPAMRTRVASSNATAAPSSVAVDFDSSRSAGRCKQGNYTYAIQVAGDLTFTEKAIPRATGDFTAHATWRHTWPSVKVVVKCYRSGLVEVALQRGAKGSEQAREEIHDHILTTAFDVTCDLTWEGSYAITLETGGGSFRPGQATSFSSFVGRTTDPAKDQSQNRAYADQCRMQRDRGQHGRLGFPRAVGDFETRGLDIAPTAEVDSFGGKTHFPTDALSRAENVSFTGSGTRPAQGGFTGSTATVSGSIRFEFRRVGRDGGVAGSGCANAIGGTAGPDRLRGTGAGDLVHGLGGADVIDGLGGNDCLYGDAGNDLLGGNAGNDLLDGGPGVDTFDAGSGDDLVKARDGNRETVQCGPGRDTVVGDRLDRVRNCERVLP